MPKIQVRRGTATQWNTANPVLAAGEFGYETDTAKFKIGDGTTKWNGAAGDGVNSLPYAKSGALTPSPYALSISSAFVGGPKTFDGSAAISLDLPATIAKNAASATKLETARLINGSSFDGTSNIISGGAIYGTTANAAATFRSIFISPSASAPVSPRDGDAWIAY